MSSSRQEYGSGSGGTGLSRGHRKNKMLGVWLDEEDYQKFADWLSKFSAGDDFSDQYRIFIHWPVQQTEGIDKTMLALKLQQVEDQKQKAR